MDNLENGVSSAPVRRRVISPAQQEQSVKVVKTQGYHNPRLLTLILLCMACIGLVCFFLVPVYFDKTTFLGQTIKIKVKLFEFLSEKGSFKIASGLILVGYSIIFLNSLLNLWHEKKVDLKLLFVICNFVSVIASIMALICGLYLIFSLDYTIISLITIAILVSVATIQSIAFLRCKELKAKVKLQYTNSKKLTIINILLLIMFIVLVSVQLFIFRYDVWVDHGLGYYQPGPDYSPMCINAIKNTSIGITLLVAICVILLYHLINNILLLSSSTIKSSKYGFISKIILSILSILYLIFAIFALVKIDNLNAEVVFIVLSCIVSIVITIISILQATKSIAKK